MLLLSGHGSSSRSVTRTLEPVKKLLNIIGHTIGVMDLSPTSGLIPVWRLSPFCARPEIELLSGRVISHPVFPDKADHVSRFFQQHGIGRRQRLRCKVRPETLYAVPRHILPAKNHSTSKVRKNVV